VGRHAARTAGRWTVVLLVLLVLVLLMSGMGYATYRYEASNSGRILPGVSIDGLAVGGLTRAEAVRLVSSGVDATLARQVTIDAAGHSSTASLADLGLHADVAGTVDRALAVSQSYSWMSRAYHRLRDRPVSKSFSVPFTLSAGPIEALVGQVAKEVVRPARNASFDLVDGKLVQTHARAGRALRSVASADLIRSAVVGRQASVQLPMRRVPPKVPDDRLGKTLVVNVTKNMLSLYDGFRVVRSYPVATAKAGFLTPDGAWSVVGKVMNPTWHNPAPNGWGAGEPLVIPPGPTNPLGTRALYLSAPGIRIHGTPSDSSIGTYASHGCIRMHIPDSEALYPLVPVGTPVFIIGAPPWGITRNPGVTGT